MVFHNGKSILLAEDAKRSDSTSEYGQNGLREMYMYNENAAI